MKLVFNHDFKGWPPVSSSLSFVIGHLLCERCVFSHNLLCKSLGLICLMQIISLYPFGWPAFNFFHFTVWMGVWLCNTKRFRMYNDKAILSELNFKL